MLSAEEKCRTFKNKKTLNEAPTSRCGREEGESSLDFRSSQPKKNIVECAGTHISKELAGGKN